MSSASPSTTRFPAGSVAGVSAPDSAPETALTALSAEAGGLTESSEAPPSRMAATSSLLRMREMPLRPIEPASC